MEDSLYGRVLLVSNTSRDDDEISLPDPSVSNGKLYFHLLKVVYCSIVARILIIINLAET